MSFFSVEVTGPKLNNAISATADNLANFSVSCWIKTTSIAATSTLIAKDKAPIAGWAVDLVGSTGVITAGSFSAGFSNIRVVTGHTVVNDGNWHNIVFTQDSSFNVHIYIDGTLDDSSFTTVGGTPYSFTTTNPIDIGADGDGSTPYTDKITFVQIWNRILSSTEITNLASSGIIPSSPLVNWEMTEGSGNSINDVANDGNILLTGSGLVWSVDLPTQIAGSTLTLSLSDAISFSETLNKLDSTSLFDVIALSETLLFGSGLQISDSTTMIDSFALQSDFLASVKTPTVEQLVNQLVPAEVKTYFKIQ